MTQHLELFSTRKIPKRYNLQNRRYLGNKFRLLEFIEEIIRKKSLKFEVFCDIFAGTGVVGDRFNGKNVKIISNDILTSNYVPLKAFLGTTDYNEEAVTDKILYLNDINSDLDNYFSVNYGNTYFTLANARKIGTIREVIEDIAENEEERMILLTSLLYAVDRIANTVGHYDAFRGTLDALKPLVLALPDIKCENNSGNKIYKGDANLLIRNILCDILYIDPPYNSRQYSDAYHVLENLITWDKPPVFGKAKKMKRTHLKSAYCLKEAPASFTNLISDARCEHILLSYNNTGESKDCRSNARISFDQIIDTLTTRGRVEVFEKDYKAFTAGKSDTNGHCERLFYCRVTN